MNLVFLRARQVKRSKIANAPAVEQLQSFHRQFQSHLQLVQRYEDWDLQDKARALVPVDRLHDEARQAELAQSSTEKLGFQDFVLIRLLHWFKNEFFKWVDRAECDLCHGDTVSAGYGEPTNEDLRFGGNRVELHYCSKCQHKSRFVRYNDPEKLLQPGHRRGRCGEWANVFTLLCRSLGYETRYIHDYTDHVWTEVYSDTLKRWVHLDSCEAAFDSPLIYEAGWGKKLNYVIAFSIDEVLDVTKRYTVNYKQLLSRRNLISGRVLRFLISKLNSQLLSGMHKSRQAFVMQRFLDEQKELSSAKMVTNAEQIGRQSGSEEWRRVRGETGTSPSFPIPSLQRSTIQFSLENDPNSLKVNGDSCLHGKQLQLTPAKNDCVGSVWFEKPFKLNGMKSLIVEFSFKITGQGADGFAIVLHSDSKNSKAIGVGGSQLGYGGISNSIAVEFDTYASVDRCNDPNGNHISIHSNGTQPNSAHHSASLGCTNSESLPKLNSGTKYFILINYDTLGKSVDVFLTDKAKTTADVSEILGDEYLHVLRVNNIQYESICSGRDFVVGFTAATGGLNQKHEILDWKIWSAQP